MTNTKSTKRALLVSVMAMVICFTMLLGTTFAWFTDSKTNSGNIIASGTLKVGLYWEEGRNDVDSIAKDASAADPIFNYNKWEPGYVEAKHVRIVNHGTLALNYKLVIEATGDVSILANVIHVYYFDEATKVTSRDMTGAAYLGTLNDILGAEKNISKTVYGGLTAGAETDLTLVFVMDVNAGNEYQNHSIGSKFAVKLLATQMASENDGLGNNTYDESQKP